MGGDLPQFTELDFREQFQKPKAQEIVPVGECKEKEVEKIRKNTSNSINEVKKENIFTKEQLIFLEKLYCSLWEENSELRKAIENQTIKVFNVPGRDLFALSIDGRNVDYIYGIDGKIYLNFKEGRKILDEYIRLLGFSSSGNFKEKLLLDGKNFDINNGDYNPDKITFTLLGEDGRELKQFSDESLKRYSKWADHLTILKKRVDEILSEWPEEKE